MPFPDLFRLRLVVREVEKQRPRIVAKVAARPKIKLLEGAHDRKSEQQIIKLVRVHIHDVTAQHHGGDEVEQEDSDTPKETQQMT